MKKKAKVHRLATGKSTMLNGAFETDNPTEMDSVIHNYHLYITTDEEIVLGDAKVFLYEGKAYVSSTSNRFDDFDMAKAKNIIASTNKSLPFNLPQIPQSFIEEYCKAGGIDEVLVEWENRISTDEVPPYHINRPKLNPNNTIIIHPVEEKMYSREEVGSKIKEFVKEYAYEWDMDDINEWIEENL